MTAARLHPGLKGGVGPERAAAPVVSHDEGRQYATADLNREPAD